MAARSAKTLLADLPAVADPQVFLCEAIGWALRQYAGTDAHEMRRYIAAKPDRLSGLSKREALKNVSKPLGATA